MDKKTTSILDAALDKSERALSQLHDHPKYAELDEELRQLRATLTHYTHSPPSVSEALHTARQILELRECVQRTAVYQDLTRLYRRDRARALALFAASRMHGGPVN